MHKIAIKQKTVCNYFLPFWELSLILFIVSFAMQNGSDGKELW